MTTKGERIVEKAAIKLKDKGKIRYREITIKVGRKRRKIEQRNREKFVGEL